MLLKENKQKISSTQEFNRRGLVLKMINDNNGTFPTMVFILNWEYCFINC